MKKLLLLCCFWLMSSAAMANHITGGEMYYVLQSVSGNNYTYVITLKLYRDCFSTGADLDPNAAISIFRNSDNTSAHAELVPMAQRIELNLTTPSPCIQNPPTVCYEVGFYTFTVTLPGSLAGYTIAYQRCCRIAGINNLIGSSSVGSTYTAQIPGTTGGANAPNNSSAKFVGADTVIVCANTNFCYDFSAVDPDKNTLGDSISYSFCSAFIGGSTGNAAPNPPFNPPYIPVPYAQPFSETAPLGSNVNINSQTGFVCGVAPSAGIYVVTVCATEWRNGAVIAVQRKDLQIKVGDCNIADASLKPEYITCDGFTYTFSNEAPFSPLVTSWYWDFGDGSAPSTVQTPTHTYADTGTYTFKLVVNRNQECSDSAIAIIKVYPGFFPGFTHAGICVNGPTQFTDTTKTNYGVVNSWSWDFGEGGTSTDVSTVKNPTYTYPTVGTKSVRFIVTNSKGCIDTLIKDVTILDKPPLTLGFRDTLICRDDTLQLAATGTGVFTWTPNYNIINPGSEDPQVFPYTTTTYHVQLNQNNCLAVDSVKVRVVEFVTLQARNDTIICLTDSVQLDAFGDALQYSWTPSASLSQANIKNPKALPPNQGINTYTVTGRIGKCVKTDQVNIITVPYPDANAGPDQTICFNSQAQLSATIVGTSFTWSPVNTLSNAAILNPIAKPKFTTSYVLSAFDNIGCPKPGRDTVVITVRPDVVPFAGNDTAVVVGQILQFNATGGTNYEWNPPVALNNPNIFNPVGVYDGSFDSIRYKVIISDEFGCKDSATVGVKIYRVLPQVFVPNAFTPNKDGKNDQFRPIAVGIKQIEYFRVFNRWGEMVFSTTVNGRGWDGKVKGIAQATETFVWVVKAIDYQGQPFFAKGTVTLIR